MEYLALEKVVVRKPFCDLFPIDPNVLSAIKEDMEAHGFDESKPIDIWRQRETRTRGGDVIADHSVYLAIDGHTRLEAARQAGIAEVPVFEHEFREEDEALAYAVANQRNRRNMNDGDILRCVEVLDNRRASGERSDLAQGCARSGKSAPDTAAAVGVSPRKVEQARTVLDHAPTPLKEEVLAGRKSINAAYNETQERRRAEADAMVEDFMAPPQGGNGNGASKPKTRPTFNRTNENVEWALWTWNPVTGCKHDCAYCYARDIANRFYPQKFEPTFLPERLSAPHNTPAPRPDIVAAPFDRRACKGGIGEKNVFVCSMADLFGKWVPAEWIDAVLNECRKAPQWNFLFLSKFPQRFEEIDWPANAWVGTTVDRQYRVKIAEKAFRNVNAPVKWLSVEPMMERLEFESLDMFDWVVMGGASASTQTPE
jgi:protein gp37